MGIDGRELTHVRGRAIRAEADRDVLTAAVQELVQCAGQCARALLAEHPATDKGAT